MCRWVALLCLVLGVAGVPSEHCPAKCECRRGAQRDGPDWVKVRCGDKEKLTYLDDDDFLNIANEVVQLNLSSNYLTSFAPKVSLIALQKLDLSKNQLSSLQANQFVELKNLRRLDVSANSIKHVDVLTFSKLAHLERLKLSQNQITTIEKGTFNPLTSLMQLDISSNPLKCDCSLLWLLDWSNHHSIKLPSNPKCETPSTFAGKPLRKIKIGIDMHCKSPAAKNRDVAVLEMNPDRGQVVFEGDSLKLQCRAQSIFDVSESEPKDRLEWSWLDMSVRNIEDVVVENRYLGDSGVIDSSLVIGRLSRNHTGVWNCRLIGGGEERGISVVVISDETKYCPIIMSSNNKGSYVWPRTIVNNTVTLPCESIQLTTDVDTQKASYYCSKNGKWQNLNTTKCPFTSETTKVLEQFSKVNLTLAKESILQSAKHFKNYTSDIKVMKDAADLIFAARTMENYLEYLDYEPELSPILIDIVNTFIELDRHYLLTAQKQDYSCTRIIKSAETITLKSAPPSTIHKTHLILEKFNVKYDSFSGMTCTWYKNPEKLFRCVVHNVHNPTESGGSLDGEVEASVQIPASLFYDAQRDIEVFRKPPSLLVAMFDSGNFFPIDDGVEEVTSAVVGVKLGNLTVTNLTDPIYVMLRPLQQFSYESVQPTPVYWDPKTNAWTSDGCQLSHELHDNLVFSCRHLGYYALMQDTSNIEAAEVGAKFRFSHPAVYIGATLLFTCLFVSVITYVFAYPVIQIPKKTKHSLMNMWVAVCLLCFLYIFGIYQTEDDGICQGVGLSLHYLTLSSLLWMCVGVNVMYKRLRKSEVIELQDDELVGEEPVQKPILGLYLVGWGIGLIVCGISGAVNMKEYSSQTHCFLTSAPALSALYVPVVILFGFLFVYFLLIRCAIYGTDANGHLSEGTQATENVDLDLLEPNFPNVDSHSVSSKTASSEVEDPEHAPMAQLKAYVIFLFIYILAWLCCALATIKPQSFAFFIPYEEDVFSIAFTFFASLLGFFTIFFYCVARNDVRNQWVLVFRWMRGKSVCRSRNVSDAAQNIPQIQIQPLPPIPIMQPVSRSSSRSSAHTKSVSQRSNSNVLKGAADLNSSTLHDASTVGTKINNVNLVVLHRQQYIVPNLIENPTHTAEMFYNPHQSTVARKFFKKQKRNMMRRNNLMTQRHLDLKRDNSSIDTSIFGTKSKVNNKNLHVDVTNGKIVHQQRNLNILSDSCEDVNIDIPVDKLRNHHRTRVKKQNTTTTNSNNSKSSNNMRSVSQQCTLEYSSEPISDSILDQKSPEKLLYAMGHASNYPILKPQDAKAEDVHSEETKRIYVNPSHDLFSSSVSASEIDELYQQIKRGPRSKHSMSEIYINDDDGPRYGSPCLSDSEITSSLWNDRHYQRVRSKRKGGGCGKDETRV